MSKWIALALKTLCLVLAATLAWQVYAWALGTTDANDVWGDFAPASDQEVTPEEAKSNAGDLAENGKDAKPEEFVVAPLRESLGAIAKSGVFGRAPVKKLSPPAFLGVVGDFAIIRSPKGREDLVREGGELDGVKVLKIATNRVLIEHDGKKTELMIYAGLGSSSLLPPKTDDPETPKPETPKPETPKPETPKPETPRTEAVKAEDAGPPKQGQ